MGGRHNGRQGLGYSDDRRGHYLNHEDRAEYQPVNYNRQGGLDIGPTVPGRGAMGPRNGHQQQPNSNPAPAISDGNYN